MSIALVFLAGFVSFLSPCFLPVVPVFSTYVAGTTPARPGSEGGAVLTATRTRAAARASVFVLAFSTVFAGLWILVGLIGYVVGDFRDTLTIVGGIILIALGLHVAGLLRIPALDRTIRAKVDGDSDPSVRRAALLGLAFGAGWTPCIGPVLGGVIGIATTQSVAEGALLLAVYCAGLGIPFILVATGLGDVLERTAWIKRHYRTIELVLGLFLIVIGFLMISGLLERLAALVPAVV